MGKAVLAEYMPGNLLPQVGLIGRPALAFTSFIVTYAVMCFLLWRNKKKNKSLRKAISLAASQLAKTELSLQAKRTQQATGRPDPGVPISTLLAAFVSEKIEPHHHELTKERRKFIKACARARAPAWSTRKIERKRVQDTVDRLAMSDEATLLRIIRGAPGKTRNAQVLALLVGLPPPLDPGRRVGK